MKNNLKNECVAEFIGTVLFLTLGMGCVAGLKLAGASYGQWEISIIWGFAVALAVYLTAGVSGAHLNPSVTVALAVFGNFPKKKVLPYIFAQFLGGVLAAAIVYALYFNLFTEKTISTAGVFTTFPNPKITLMQAFIVEAFITGILMMTILGITDDGNGIPTGALGPAMIGILVAVIGGAFGPLTGFAMNAARDFGPRLLATFAGWGSDAFTGGHAIPYALIPLIAPIIGALIGAFIYKTFIGNPLRKNTIENK